jgi:hypothetical protein
MVLDICCLLDTLGEVTYFTMRNDKSDFQDIFSDILQWAGLIIAGLSIAGLFVSSEWLIKASYETMTEFGSNDSEASSFLYKVFIEILNFSSWLKVLPTGYKISGIIIGGLLLIIGSTLED